MQAVSRVTPDDVAPLRLALCVLRRAGIGQDEAMEAVRHADPAACERVGLPGVTAIAAEVYAGC